MAWNFGDEVQFGGGECHGARYIIHFYCLAVEAGFYSDVVECLPVDPASWVRFPAGAGKIFSLYDNGASVGEYKGRNVRRKMNENKYDKELKFTRSLIQ